MNVIIVGGGIAGLTAGVYARQSGFDATIFEMHTIPGGNSTSWRRGGYLFEGGMHWLTGSSENAPLYKLWKEVGALQANNPIYNRDPFITYMGDPTPICLYRDTEKLRKHLLEVSPQDAGEIEQFIKDIKVLGKMSMPVTDIKGVKVKYKSAPPIGMLFSMLGALGRMNKLGAMSVNEYAAKFKHEGICALLLSIVGSDEFSASSIAFTLGGLALGDGGYPKGGSLRMAQNMADTFTKLGGTIEYQKRVERVCVENGRTTGVIVGGEEIHADAVIVTADALTAIDKLFASPLHEPWMDELRSAITPLNCTYVCLGVSADLSDMPENMLLPIEKPFINGGVEQHALPINQYSRFEGYAPKGCTPIVCVLMEDTYDEWKAAKENGTYESKKQALADTVIDRLASAIPKTAGKVDVWDIATPLTYERYCGTYRGSWMSVLKPGKNRQMYPCRSETIKGLYFAGQRLMLPGGLPVALSTGRQAVQNICLDSDTVFQCEY